MLLHAITVGWSEEERGIRQSQNGQNSKGFQVGIQKVSSIASDLRQERDDIGHHRKMAGNDIDGRNWVREKYSIGAVFAPTTSLCQDCVHATEEGGGY